ncbi:MULTISPECIES: hypothetical protein [unclassified Paenibacillus]|uniref:hypothetical protein n=1 Tax=unclassified Paenibacillus TaxID=185978 RepID=UPI00104742BB|nr:MULTISPECIES: hypothetical protein [unclassified Paenibacillus]NIK66622.1 hypothetical protein [Paenibacillus sp. BK720]TCN00600.1 hypothetical protein EV294_10148 [Paenibacillus sp. BK033]
MKWIISLVMAMLLLVPAHGAVAMPKQEAVDQMINALLRHKYDLAQSYLANGARMPEIREDSPILQVEGLPSTKIGHRILIGYFRDEAFNSSRMAFIWDLTIKQDRIIRLDALYDGANPLVNENKVVRDYRNRFDRHVMVPGQFPFEVHKVRGEIKGQRIALQYVDDANDRFLLIQAEPVQPGMPIMDGPKPLKAKGSLESRFQKDGMQYMVTLGHKRWLSHVKAEGLGDVIASMK